MREPLDVRPRYDLPYPSLEVRNPAHQTRYRVLLPGYPDREGSLCPCPDFGRRGVGTCKHLEAAWLFLADHPYRPPPVRVPPPGAIDRWTRIEQRVRQDADDQLPARARLKAESRLLIDSEPNSEP